MGTYLVVANKTAQTAELREGLQKLTARDPQAEYVLLVPVAPSDAAGKLYEDASGSAEAMASAARDELIGHGLKVVDARIGDGFPLRAIEKALDQGDRTYNGIVVSTLPAQSSAWLAQSLPQRVGRRFGLPVRHIEGGQSEAQQPQ